MRKSKICLLLSTLLITSTLVMTSCAKKESPKTSDKTENEEILDEDTLDEKEDEITNDDETANEEDTSTDATSNDKNEDKDKDKDKKETTDTSAPDVENTKPNTQDDTPDKKPVEETKDKASDTISYPTFSDIKNSEKINKLVENYIKKLEKSYNSDTDDSVLEATYTVMTQNDKYISLKFSGNIKGENLAYSSKFISTLNIDIEKGSIINLGEIAEINASFVSTFDSLLETKFQELGLQRPNNLKTENLEGLLRQSDNQGEYISDTQSYITGNAVVIILSVPHAIGDYIEITVPIL